MFEILKQSESTAVRRRLYFQLIDSADALSGKVVSTSGVKVSLSKNGATPANSTADITAISTGTQPGEYYLELTAGECDTVGQIVGYLKPTGCLAARLQGTIVAYDPFADGASANAIADAFLDRANAVETGLTARQCFRLMGAVLFGKSSGLDTSTAVFRAAVSDSKVRVTATEDVNGNRSAIVTDAT